MMEQILNIKLPISNPILILIVILVIVLFAPLLFQRLRMPGIVGLILCGVLVGEHGLNLLSKDVGGVNLFSTIGLLYIMFLAGLEIDMSNFKKNRSRSITFGMLTFFIPLIIGFFTFYSLFNFSFISSLLIASTFSTHTLLSYPIAARLGINQSESVTITIGGTIITDTAVLLLLAMISASTHGNLDGYFWLRTGLSLTGFSLLVLWVFPILSRRFFKHMKSESASQYTYILLIVFLSGFLAEAAGIEPIIGAFFAGLALNRLIPHNSALMNKVLFIGNTLFIPVFLISVGMLINLKITFDGFFALAIASTLIIVALSTKYLAAWITQLIYKYSVIERNLIFGLSCSHAAAIIAVILVGFNLKIVDVFILNGVILIILVSSLISSFITEIYGRKLAVIEGNKEIDLQDVPERILVPTANPISMESLIEFALLIKDKNSREPIYPLTVVPNDEAARQILLNNKILEKIISNTISTDNQIFPVTRVDLNVSNGISRAIKEMIITKTIIGWNKKVTTADFFFGSVLDNLLSTTDQMIMVTKVRCPLNNVKKIVVLVPPNAELETGFESWIIAVKNLAKKTGSLLKFYAQPSTLEKLKLNLSFYKGTIKSQYNIFQDWNDYETITKQIHEDDIFIFISARKKSLSYNIHLENIPKLIAKYLEDYNFVIIYPVQKTLADDIISTQIDGFHASAIEENIELINRFGSFMKKLFRSEENN